jgi:hypothetical protein
MFGPAPVARLLGQSHLRTSLTSLGALLSLALWAPLAAAEPKDREASALAKQAMDTDYLGTQFKDAEKKLQKALKLCSKQHCAGPTRARLHLDLAIVYIAGLKKQQKGKKEMQAAIAADASVELSPDFSTPEVEKAFVAAGGEKPEKKAAVAEPDEDEDQPKPEEHEKARAEEADDGGTPKNWLSLSFQQDLLSYKQTNGVCAGAAQYQCFLQGQSFAGTIYTGAGDQLKGGVGFATKRVLFGYERVLGDNLTLGARLGFAFGGSPKATNGTGTSFLPFHAEARASYWFGEAPFARDGLRGYAGLAAGLGEVDGHVTVEYYVDQAGYQANAKGKLDAWRKTGNVLVGLHGGVAYAFTKQQQLFLELRLLQLLGATALGGAINVGYGFGL